MGSSRANALRRARPSRQRTFPLGAVLTRDLFRAMRMVKQLCAGIVS
jgi:hypothetical protein